MITLCRPIVLRDLLNDMTEETRHEADLLLRGVQFFHEGTGKIVKQVPPVKQEDGTYLVQGQPALQDGALYGSQAVTAYRKFLGLPERSIQQLDEKRILATVWNHGGEEKRAILDILFFLNRVKSRNDRTEKLNELKAPQIILVNEERLLQEALEALLDNEGNYQKPFTRFYEDTEISRLSLKKFGYTASILAKEEPYKGDDIHIEKEESDVFQDIFLSEPVVLREMLKDMDPEAMKNAAKMLNNEYAFSENGEILRVPQDSNWGQNIKVAAELPNGTKFGSDAVIAYRKALGLVTSPLTRISVEKIMERATSRNDQFDLLLHLSHVQQTNKALRMLKFIFEDADNQASYTNVVYRDLQRTVEYLFNNCWCRRPYMATTEEGMTPRASLVTLGLLPEDFMMD